MSQRAIRRTLAAGIAVALAVGQLLAATEAGATATTSQAFTLTASGRMVLGGPLVVRFDGSGSSNLLGAVRNSGAADITGVALSPCLGGLVNTNVETYTTATGDTLTITSQDVACTVGLLRLHGTGHWTVTGATGNLRGVTGSGTIGGGGDFVTATFSFTVEGTLDFPAS
jgi:hypothetical protein